MRGSCGAGSPAAVEVRGLSWRPVGRRVPVLRDVDLIVAPGERVLLAGPSGSGKSTLLRALAGVLTTAESGTLTGAVTRGGVPVAASGERRAPVPPPVGLLLQEPDDAVVAGRVGRDVAFGPENLALPRDETARRVSDALADVAFPYGPDHRTAALSGGERQRLALAGALAMRTPLLLLDEPLAMLDPDAAATVRRAVLTSVARHDAALVVVDHHLDRWVDAVDRLVVLTPDGRVLVDGPIRQVLQRRRDQLAATGLWMPGLSPPGPTAIDPSLLAPRTPVGPPGRAALSTVEVSHRRPRTPADSLTAVSLAVPAGRVTALTGPSGAGKSTLAQLLVGMLCPTAGSVLVDPVLACGLARPVHRWRSRDLATRVGWVSQHPERAFVARRSDAEVAATPRALAGRRGGAGPSDDGLAERIAVLLAAVGLADRGAVDPYRLSGGEQRRLALAAAVAHGPGVLVLDEPTVGQDRATWAAVAGLVVAARAAGVAVLACTHDQLLVQAVADSETRLAAGRVDATRSRRPVPIPGPGSIPLSGSILLSVPIPLPVRLAGP